MKIRISNITPPDDSADFISAQVHFSGVLDESPCSFLGDEISVLVCFQKEGSVSLTEIEALSVAQAKRILSLALEKIDSV